LYQIVSNCIKLYQIVSNCIKLYQIVSNCMILYHIVSKLFGKKVILTSLQSFHWLTLLLCPFFLHQFSFFSLRRTLTTSFCNDCPFNDVTWSFQVTSWTTHRNEIRCQFYQCFTNSFYMHKSQKCKKDTDNLT